MANTASKPVEHARGERLEMRTSAVELDVGDQTSIHSVARRVADEHPDLNVLINFAELSGMRRQPERYCSAISHSSPPS